MRIEQDSISTPNIGQEKVVLQTVAPQIEISASITTSQASNLAQDAALQREAALVNKPQVATDISTNRVSPVETKSLKLDNYNLAIIITGPFGSGKDTIANQFINDKTSNIQKVVLHTTRQKGPNELDGREYHFIDREKFYEMVKDNKFIQWNEFKTGCYGTAENSVKSLLNSHKDAVFAVGINVANTLKIGLKNANIPFVEMFVSPISREELEKPNGIDEAIEILKERMIKRGRGEKEFDLLIQTAREWLSDAHNFKNIVENSDGKLDITLNTVKELIQTKKEELAKIKNNPSTEDSAAVQFEKFGFINDEFFKLHNLNAKGNVAIIISGPSGVGKGTILNKAFKDDSLKLAKVISSTTRKPRPNETNRVDYYFITKEEFEKKIEANEFLEVVKGTNDNYYGNSEKQLQEIFDGGKNPLFDIDIKGGNFFRYILKRFNIPVIDIFVSPVPKDMLNEPYGIEKSKEILKERLIHRGSGETPEQIQDRLNKAVEFLNAANSFTYFIENTEGNLEKAIEKFIKIVKGKDI